MSNSNMFIEIKPIFKKTLIKIQLHSFYVLENSLITKLMYSIK
jgi:hypothetical protein